MLFFIPLQFYYFCTRWNLHDTANCLADAISTQGGSALQASCHLEAVAEHLSDSVLQTTAEKVTDSNETRKRDFQAGNKVLKVSAADGCTAQGSDSEDRLSKKKEIVQK